MYSVFLLLFLHRVRGNKLLPPLFLQPIEISLTDSSQPTVDCLPPLLATNPPTARNSFPSTIPPQSLMLVVYAWSFTLLAFTLLAT